MLWVFLVGLKMDFRIKVEMMRFEGFIKGVWIFGYELGRDIVFDGWWVLVFGGSDFRELVR